MSHVARGFFASRRRIMVLWGFFARCRCLVLLWGFFVNTRRRMLLWGFFASSRRLILLLRVFVMSTGQTDKGTMCHLSWLFCSMCAFCYIFLIISLLPTAPVRQHQRGAVSLCSGSVLVHVLGVAIRKFETQRELTGSVRNGVQESSGRCRDEVSGLPRAVNCLPMEAVRSRARGA
jgi:hypothetical protein